MRRLRLQQAWLTNAESERHLKVLGRRSYYIHVGGRAAEVALARTIWDGPDLTRDDATDFAPNDDAGSETLARYEFQITLTAWNCIELILDDDIQEIICEWHEDYVVVRTSQSELVSVKHIEPSTGSWTLAKIVGDGGLKHLFDRWRAAGRTPACRLRTNGGLKAGANEASAIARACAGNEVSRVAGLLMPRLGGDDLSEVEDFLSILTIDAELPKRDDLLARLLVHELPPLCEILGWSPDEMASRFEVVRSVVSEAARRDIRSEGRSPGVPGHDTTALARAQAAKSVTRKKLVDAMSRVAPAHASKLTAKLDAGGFGPTDVERCKRLRAEWLAFAYQWDPGVPGDSTPDRIRQEVEDLAVLAETKTATQGSVYGREMRAELVSLAGGQTIGLPGRQLSEDLILGVAYDATDKCRIWWSARFDLPSQDHS